MYFEDDAPPSFADGSPIGGMGPRRLAVRSSIFGQTLSVPVALTHASQSSESAVRSRNGLARRASSCGCQTVRPAMAST
jgi:hypothetical protein